MQCAVYADLCVWVCGVRSCNLHYYPVRVVLWMDWGYGKQRLRGGRGDAGGCRAGVDEDIPRSVFKKNGVSNAWCGVVPECGSRSVQDTCR